MDQLELVSQPIPEYRTIQLTKGQSAIVDAADYEWLSLYKWYATWCENSQSFYAVRSSSRKDIGGRHQIYMHREILGLKRGDPRQGDHEEITHTLDNRRSNLRISTVLENKQNARATRQNTSGFIGVSFHKKISRWISVISHENKHVYIGCFKTKVAAAKARDRKAIELRGQFARLNFPKEDYGFNPA